MLFVLNIYYIKGKRGSSYLSQSEEWESLKLVVDNKLEASSWCESCPDWDESFIEAHWSTLLQD